MMNGAMSELIMEDGIKIPNRDGNYKLDLFEKAKFVHDTNKVNKSGVTKHERTVEDSRGLSCNTCTQHHFVREKYADGFMDT